MNDSRYTIRGTASMGAAALGRRSLLCAGAAATALAALPRGARAQVADLNDAINKAGRQRMLSQRTSKAYIALVQGVENALAQQVLDRSMALFDRQLAELKAFAPTADLRATYAALEGAWSDYKATLVGARPARTAIPTLMTQAGKVLALANKGTQQYEAQLNKPLGRLVNVAGRQRMLSQRMAAFYLASQVPVDPGGARAEIASARTEFAASLDLLRNAPESTPRIRDQLQLAEGQWVLFDNALGKTAAGTLKPQSDVFIASENLLQVMDQVTAMYAGVGA